jgi:flagellar protein FliS
MEDCWMYKEENNMTPNGYAAQAYRGIQVNTASPAELTLMLYDGAIKFCNVAELGIDNNDILKAHTNIMKAERIIEELRNTLDFKYEVANDFDRVYDYIYATLVEANIKKDKEILEQALSAIREMRDTWKEVMKSNHLYVK